MFGHQQRLETAVAVARRLDPHLAIARQHRLGRAAVAMVGNRFGSLRARLVAQVVTQFRVQRGLDQGFLERHTRLVDRFPGHRTGQK
jgi:hypothetical protein